MMSRYQFGKTLVFIAFAGEEQGLIGSTLHAGRARKQNQVIEAVLNKSGTSDLTSLHRTWRSGDLEPSVFRAGSTRHFPTERELGPKVFPHGRRSGP